MMKVYATQYGATWSFDWNAWLRMVHACARGEIVSFDTYGKQLARRRSRWESQHRTANWDLSDWQEELRRLQS